MRRIPAMMKATNKVVRRSIGKMAIKMLTLKIFHQDQSMMIYLRNFQV